MRVRDLNWMQLEAYLEGDDRIVLPIASTEQHAYLSLETDNILGQRVAEEAAEPLAVPVLPVLAYGVTPAFAAFPGSPSLRLETLGRVLVDILDSLHGQGFRRFLVLNAHGGNIPAGGFVREWLSRHPHAQAIFHSWWCGPQVLAVANEIDETYSHANWGENFPWTRLEGVDSPAGPKPMLVEEDYRVAPPDRVRRLIGDGSFGGSYQRPDDEMQRIWQAGVEEVRDLLVNAWRS
jgi:creatinine amidohydrolase